MSAAAASAAAAAVAAPQPDEPSAGAESEEEETDHEASSTDDDSSSSSSGQDGTGSSGAKKKKKKKKKKKATGAGAGDAADGGTAAAAGGGGAPAAAAAQDKQELDRRFQKALESARQGEDMWVLLNGANVHDAKVKKLVDVLRSNSSITSVNLSSNPHIGDEGVQALVEVLQQGGCSELISLDLRDNALSPEAEALLADLAKKRKQLDIATGPLPAPEPEGGASSSGGGKAGAGRGRARGRGVGAAAGRGDAAAPGSPQQQQIWSDQSLQELAKTSPMFRRYFQIGGGDEGEADDSSSSGEEEGEQAEQVPPPEEVWDKVTQLLPQGVESIPELSEALVTISRALDAEMAAMPAHEEDAGLQDFQPHFRAVIQHLPQLGQVLQLQPAAKMHQSSREPQPAVGSHRVWTSAILHMLLLHNNGVIDRAVADAGLLPAVVALALHHDRCSAVQCRAVEMLRCSLQSSVQDLWRGLFTPGFGQQLQQPGSSELVPPLHEALVDLASSSTQHAMGKRPCVTGFASEVANTLLQASDASSPEQLCPALVTLLEGCGAWQRSIAPGGAIHSLLQEQDGQLCGPPPARPAPSVDSIDDDSLDASQLGGVMSGQQLMALLAHMGAGDLSAAASPVASS